jgi:antitoxin component of MazEF toxin-antitoxin module
MGINDKPSEGLEDKRQETASPQLQYTLEALLAQITRENLHGESDSGEPQGKELW